MVALVMLVPGLPWKSLCILCDGFVKQVNGASFPQSFESFSYRRYDTRSRDSESCRLSGIIHVISIINTQVRQFAEAPSAWYSSKPSTFGVDAKQGHE